MKSIIGLIISSIICLGLTGCSTNESVNEYENVYKMSEGIKLQEECINTFNRIEDIINDKNEIDKDNIDSYYITDFMNIVADINVSVGSIECDLQDTTNNECENFLIELKKLCENYLEYEKSSMEKSTDSDNQVDPEMYNKLMADNTSSILDLVVKLYNDNI